MEIEPECFSLRRGGEEDLGGSHEVEVIELAVGLPPRLRLRPSSRDGRGRGGGRGCILVGSICGGGDASTAEDGKKTARGREQ